MKTRLLTFVNMLRDAGLSLTVGETLDALHAVRIVGVERRALRDGLAVTFKGWCYPLGDYGRALEESGFLIEAIREPLPSPGAPPRCDKHRRIAMFLMLRAAKPSAGAP